METQDYKFIIIVQHGEDKKKNINVQKKVYTNK